MDAGYEGGRENTRKMIANSIVIDEEVSTL
jgi:hypothetical protein